MRKVVISSVWLLLGFSAAAHVLAIEVSTRFFGSVDLARYRTYAWQEGRPAPNFEVEREIRRAVEEQLAAKGLAKSDGVADCFVKTLAVGDRGLQVGVLWVEILDGANGKVVWRGEAGGALRPDPKKTQKVVKKVIKKMIKTLPEFGGRS